MSENKLVKIYRGFKFSSDGYAGEDYLSFERKAKNDLKKQLGENVEIQKFYKGHYSFSAVLKDKRTEGLVYVSIPDVRFFQDEWIHRTLYRTMKHEKDFSGGMNHYTAWEKLGETIEKGVL